jgi:hypothetical protein
MGVKFVSAEFSPSDRRGRAKIAREMAADAGSLAVAAFNEEMRNSYLELKRHWQMLADEFERADDVTSSP